MRPRASLRSVVFPADADDIEPGYRGMIGSLPMEGIVVLLGANSSGKTTVLELLEWGLAAGHLRHPTVRRNPAFEEIWLEIEDHDLRRTIADAARQRGVHTDDLARFLSTCDTDRYWLNVYEDEAYLFPRQDEELPELHLGRVRGLAPLLGLPTLIAAPAVDADPDVALADAVEAGIRAFHGLGDDAAVRWDQDIDGGIGISDLATAVLAFLQTEIDRHVPVFLLERGNIRARFTPIGSWLDGGRRVTLVTDSPYGEVPLLRAGQGARRWATVLIRIAGARTEQLLRYLRLRMNATADEGDHGPSASDDLMAWLNAPVADLDEQRRLERAAGATRMVVIIDEPELHLHATAQTEIAEWLATQASEQAAVLLATHSPRFLDLPTELVSYYHVRARTWAAGQDDEAANLRDVTATMSSYLRASATELGFEEATWVTALRGVVYVEGRHDLRLLQHFYGAALRAHRLHPVALHGGGKWRSVAESELLAALGIPMYFVFDDVRRDAAFGGHDGGHLTDEMKWVRSLVRLRDEEGRAVESVPYEDPDVVCAIPPSVVVRVYPHTADRVDELSDGDGWGPAVDRFRSAGVHNFKRWLLNEQLGFSKPATSVIERLIDALGEDDRPTPAFQRMWQALIGAAGARPR